MDEKLVALVTKLVLEQLQNQEDRADKGTFATKSTNAKEVVIGVGPAFGSHITKMLNQLQVQDALNEVVAGIEEEGMDSRIVKVFKSSDLSVIGKEAANLAGSGIGVGIQSKGTTLIHQADLQVLSNLELFPQAPLMTLAHYRQIGKNAAKYAKGEKVTPVTVENDPMVRAAFQVKAALMHLKETEQMDRMKKTVEWGVQ